MLVKSFSTPSLSSLHRLRDPELCRSADGACQVSVRRSPSRPHPCVSGSRDPGPSSDRAANQFGQKTPPDASHNLGGPLDSSSSARFTARSPRGLHMRRVRSDPEIQRPARRCRVIAATLFPSQHPLFGLSEEEAVLSVATAEHQVLDQATSRAIRRLDLEGEEMHDPWRIGGMDLRGPRAPGRAASPHPEALEIACESGEDEATGSLANLSFTAEVGPVHSSSSGRLGVTRGIEENQPSVAPFRPDALQVRPTHAPVSQGDAGGRGGFLFEDDAGEGFSALDVDANGMSIICNSRGCRPFSWGSPSSSPEAKVSLSSSKGSSTATASTSPRQPSPSFGGGLGVVGKVGGGRGWSYGVGVGGSWWQQSSQGGFPPPHPTTSYATRTNEVQEHGPRHVNTAPGSWPLGNSSSLWGPHGGDPAPAWQDDDYPYTSSSSSHSTWQPQPHTTPVPEAWSEEEKASADVYYRFALKRDPDNALLLRNYAKYMFEVCSDITRAEELFLSAIELSPNDGEVLVQYAKMVWEGKGDAERAGEFFERAIQASPDDSYVLAAYASFLWSIETKKEASQKEQQQQQTEREPFFEFGAPSASVVSPPQG